MDILYRALAARRTHVLTTEGRAAASGDRQLDCVPGVRLDHARSGARFVVPLGVSSICRVGRFVLVVLILCRRPAGEQSQSVLGGAVRFGAVGGKGQPGVGREFHDLVGEAEVACDGVVELFGAGSVQDHIVDGPGCL